MRVDPTGVSPIPQPTAKAAPRDTGKAAESAGSPPSPEPEGFVPTGELAALLEAARQAPEVRSEVIEAVKARLAAGELNTAAAAAGAAQAMLNQEGTPPG